MIATLAISVGGGTAGARLKSITDHRFDLPSLDQLANVLTLQDYNTRVVVVGVSLLGLAAGLIGSFMLLRKRALLGDALAHATLPGIGIAFMMTAAAGGTGKSLIALLGGAAISGVLGVLAILLIVHATRIKEDAALGIVLSVFFGLGVAILGVIQTLGSGNAAGLKTFIYGKTASMLLSDAQLIAGVAAGVILVCLFLFKEFTQLCFDTAYARAQGWPVLLLDMLMMAVVVTVTVIGLQAVGLVLMIALLVIPAAAARFWTNRLPTMLLAAALIGALSGYVGAAISALAPRLPAGAIIVLAAGLSFGFSMIFGSARGVLRSWLGQWAVSRRVARQHLLRALFEISEQRRGQLAGDTGGATLAELAARRTWSAAVLRRTLRAARKAGEIGQDDRGRFVLTEPGVAAGWRVARNHRLWELFLISHADIAPSHVDRDADEVEHVLDAEMIADLERELREAHPNLALPPSPHRLLAPRPGSAT